MPTGPGRSGLLGGLAALVLLDDGGDGVAFLDGINHPQEGTPHAEPEDFIFFDSGPWNGTNVLSWDRYCHNDPQRFGTKDEKW